jgi:nucleoside-diphosphate-sugar epimerase
MEQSMARIVIIGGSGHVGTYLVPRLVELGHDVVNVSRGTAKPYRPHYAWSRVENFALDRVAEEKTGEFGKKIANLNPEIVVDMISFDLASTQQIVEALRGKVAHYLFCSSIWV